MELITSSNTHHFQRRDVIACKASVAQNSKVNAVTLEKRFVDSDKQAMRRAPDAATTNDDRGNDTALRLVRYSHTPVRYVSQQNDGFRAPVVDHSRFKDILPVVRGFRSSNRASLAWSSLCTLFLALAPTVVRPCSHHLVMGRHGGHTTPSLRFKYLIAATFNPESSLLPSATTTTTPKLQSAL